MKKYIYFLIAASVCLFVGCSDDDDTVTVDPDVVGEWQLIEWNGNAADDFDVYLEFRTDGAFNLYQRVEYSYYEHYVGKFSADESLLKGCYNNGESWEYSFVLSDGGYTLTLTDTKSNEANVYTRTEIPDEVRNTSVTRSVLGSKRFL